MYATGQPNLERRGGQGEVSQLSLSFNCNWGFGCLASEWFQNTLFAALGREADKVQVTLGSLACSPEGGYLLGLAHAI